MVVRVVSWENSTSNIEFALKDTLNNLITTEQPCSKISTSMAEPIYYRALGLPHPPPANQPHPTHQLHATHTTTEVGPLPAEQITSHTTAQVAYLLILMISLTYSRVDFLAFNDREVIKGQAQKPSRYFWASAGLGIS